MRINHNAAATNTYSRLSSAQGAQAKSLEKLSSGLRINRAGDDAAGLAISEKMRGQIGGLNQAVRNAQDGISLIQTAEGGLNETHSILNRMRELAVQSSNDTNTNADRIEIQKEVDQLSQEVSRISANTEFNEKNLLDGNFSGKFHIGANQGQNMSLEVSDMSSEALGVKGEAYTAQVITDAAGVSVKSLDNKEVIIAFTALDATTPSAREASVSFDKDSNTITITQAQDAGTGEAATTTNNELVDLINKSGAGVVAQLSGVASTGNTVANAAAPATAFTSATWAVDTTQEVGINVSTQEKADLAIKTIDKAISNVSTERSKLGSVQNRLDHTINNLTTTSENLSAAESRIRDVDMAKEMMEFTKNNILSQAGTAMLAQANQMPQGVLQLLG